MNTTTFTTEQLNALTAQAAEMMEKFTEGTTAREMMAQIYAETLPDKTIAQGQMMADQLLSTVKDFDANYHQAQENEEQFITNFQDAVDENKSCFDQCNYWLKFTAALSAATIAMGDPNADQAQLLNDIQHLEISEEDATPERASELRQQALEALQSSSILFNALTEQIESLKEFDTGNEAAALLIDLSGHEVEYRAMVSMLAYTQLKTGEFENIPPETTAEEMAIMVCTAIEEVQIIDAVNRGHLAIDVASGLLRILGSVAVLMISVALLRLTSKVIFSFFGSLLAIPAILVLAAGMLHIMRKGYTLWSENRDKHVQDSVGISSSVIFLGPALHGALRLIDYAKENILPEVLMRCQQLKEKLMQFIRSTVTSLQEKAHVVTTH